MATPFVDFRPAQVMGDKEAYVCYYVIDPTNDKLKRMRIRCSRIKNPRERAKYATLLCAEINRKLYNGWNPLIGEDSASTKRVSIGPRTEPPSATDMHPLTGNGSPSRPNFCPIGSPSQPPHLHSATPLAVSGHSSQHPCGGTSPSHLICFSASPHPCGGTSSNQLLTPNS